MNAILVTCNVHPDLDGFACAVAYTEFLNKQDKQARTGIFGEPSDEVKFILNRFNFSLPDKVQNSEDFDKIAFMDASLIQGFYEKLLPEKVIEIIDHRKINELHLFPNAKAQIELVGAASTLVAERFKQSSVDISKCAAILLQGGIISNTLNFKSNTTTQKDKDIAEWLKEKSPLSDNFANEMFLAKSDLKGEKLKEVMYNDFGHFQKEKQGEKVGIAQIEMIGAKELANARKQEIFEHLNALKEKFNTDLIFLSIIELRDGFNLFITNHQETQNILKSVFKVEFEDDIALNPGLMMRKEIWPMLRDKISNI